MTIIQAVVDVMKEVGRPMAVPEVLSKIQEKKSYDFRGQNPLSILRAQMRRHSDQCPPATAASPIYLKVLDKQHFELLTTPIARASAKR